MIDRATVAVTQRERAADFEKRVLAVAVAAGLVGDALGLAVAFLEEVLLDHTAARQHRSLAVADADGLAAVLAETFARAEVVMVDLMPARAAIAEPDDKRDPLAGLPLKRAMIHPMARAIQSDPATLLRAARLQRADDGAVRHAAVSRESLRVQPELNQVVDIRVGILEMQSLDDEVLAADPQRAGASENGLAGRRGFQCDWCGFGPLPSEVDCRIAPLALAQDQVVPRPRSGQRRLHSGNIADRNVPGDGRNSQYEQDQQSGERLAGRPEDVHCCLSLEGTFTRLCGEFVAAF
ncbi:MAG: hypothetical protein SH850_09730 [Planctomycetaceae bacterium]|nr:hypothetical protein [Planctomycetaceae bacterium]